MKRLRVLLVLSSATLCWTNTAAAQVSVPLPGGHPATPAPAPRTTVPLPSTTPAPTPAPAPAQNINPYHRDLQLTVPLTFRGKILGEIPILLTRDGRFAVYQPIFRLLLSKLLNPDGLRKLDQGLGAHDPFFPGDLAETGISLQFNASDLSVAVLSIEPASLQTTALFETASNTAETPDFGPAPFAGYLNLNLYQSFTWQSNAPRPGPSLALIGALNLHNFVLEGSGMFTDQSRDLNGKGGYHFDRDYVRLVYDEPGEYRRWLAGDLSPEIRGDQGYVQMGGVGVLRERRRFNLDRTAVLQGNRQIVLQNDSTVSIYRNGVLFSQNRLPAGPYDLSSLPLLAGGNDIRIEVKDNAGRVQNIQYQSYSDPIDLFPGDYEYGAYIGAVGDTLGGSPHYTSDIAFTGFFRKAFIDHPALGVGLQLSRKVQQITGQTQLYLWNSSRVQFDAGYSHSQIGGSGYSASIEFDKTLNRNELTDSFILRADYSSRRFTGIGAPDPDNSTAYSIDAQYTRAFTPKFYVTGLANYIHGRGPEGDSYRFGLAGSYRFNPKWSLRLGADYAHFDTGGGRQNGLGATISLVFQPQIRDRAEARYDSGTDTSALSYSHASTGGIGSVDYGVLAQNDPESTSIEGYAEYTGNRFDASFTQSTYGDGVGSVTDSQVSSVQLGTAIAFADGHFGLSRRITDSFAIFYPHPTLGDHRIVAGQSLAPGDFISRSGTFGGAVNNYLASYVDQSITYDVENPPPGYDIGPGIYRIRPSYHSGYAIEVGTAAFVSAVGTLIGEDGKPVALAVGTISPLDQPNAAATPFFTNGAGRFAVQNLLPGGKYRVSLAEGRGSFDVVVPQDSSGLLRLNEIRIGQGEAK
jgi:outer membrane usher protein